DGVAVEVTQRGLAEMISALPAGVFVLARVHSHPSAAFHSPLDDENMLISHEGAISIVVPHFARSGMELATCSINELRHGQGWRGPRCCAIGSKPSAGTGSSRSRRARRS